jgi:phage protein D/phage baseplate assembly protein gpV
MPHELASQVSVSIDGQALPAATQALMVEIVVEQHAHLPAMFSIAFVDKKAKILDEGTLDLTKSIEINVLHDDGNNFSLIKGEITSLEPRFEEGMAIETVVRGYDKSHRLYRESKSAAFKNVKDSDLASQFASGAGLSAQVDATSTVYDALYQDNQSDLAFLMERAWRIGYECFVEDGKLYFRKPPTSGTTAKLVFGEDLREFHPRLSLAEQVDEVTVKGWDMKKVEPIIGQAKKGKLYPSVGESKDGANWASTFGDGKKIVVDQPVLSQSEAEKMAQARLDEISGAFITADGIAFRRPDIKAGNFVEIEKVGKRFSGKYLVTSARHSYTPESGLLTEFSVRGTRSGLLFEQLTHQNPVEKWGGVVPAIVTDTDDPEDLGRVKLKYPWMTEDADSDWARVVSPGAGSGYGFCLIPEIDDEVIVAFEHGDINRPYVLGGVWNGKAAIPPPVAGAATGEKPLVRSWRSTNGNEITMYDNADKKVEILTAEGHSFVLDDANKKVELKTSGGHSVLCDDQGGKVEIVDKNGNKVTMEMMNVTIESSGDMTLKAAMNMKIEAGINVDIKAGPMVNVKGGMINLN